jgi:hypothetical protein
MPHETFLMSQESVHVVYRKETCFEERLNRAAGFSPRFLRMSPTTMQVSDIATIEDLSKKLSGVTIAMSSRTGAFHFKADDQIPQHAALPLTFIRS